MAFPPDSLKKIDCSLGNPLFPLTSVANYAFREARKDLHRYQFLNAGRSDPSVCRVLDTLSDYFTARGIQPPHWSGLPYTHMLPVGGGTTAGFEMVVRYLAGDVEKENRRRLKEAIAPVKPAILMPVPTYGFFQDAAINAGLTIVPVHRDLQAGGILHFEDVRAAILDAHKQGLRIVSFFDSNPNNPTGLVRGEKETRALAKLFDALSHHYQQQDTREGTPDNGQMILDLFDLGDLVLSRRNYRWEGPAGRVRIIDDMVYDGLEYGDEKPFSFAQIEECYKDCFVLFGTSKAGLANLRAGLVIGDSKDLYELGQMQLRQEYFPPKTALHALEGYFSLKDSFAGQRANHLQRMNKAHRLRGLLMKALVNGLGTMPETKPGDSKTLTNMLVRHTGKTRSECIAMLYDEIPGVKILTTPQSGFFHLIDFGDLKGRQYPNHHTRSKRYGGMTDVEDGQALEDIFKNHLRLHMAGGGWMGLGNDSMITRMTYAMPIPDIIAVAERLRAGVDIFGVPKAKPQSSPVSILHAHP